MDLNTGKLFEDKEVYTCDEVAKRWKLSSKTIRRYVDNEELKGFYVGKNIRIYGVSCNNFQKNTSPLN